MLQYIPFYFYYQFLQRHFHKCFEFAQTDSVYVFNRTWILQLDPWLEPHISDVFVAEYSIVIAILVWYLIVHHSSSTVHWLEY